MTSQIEFQNTSLKQKGRKLTLSVYAIGGTSTLISGLGLFFGHHKFIWLMGLIFSFSISVLIFMSLVLLFWTIAEKYKKEGMM